MLFFFLVVYIGTKEIHGLEAMHEIGCTRCQLLAAEWEDFRKECVKQGRYK